MANDLNRSIKIYLDNSAAMTSADELQKRIGQLEGKLIDLQTAGKGNTDQAKKVEKELIAQTQKFEKYKREVADTERVLKNLSGATYNELIKAKKDIDKQLKSTTRNTDLYNQRLQVQKSISRELAMAQKDLRTEIGCQATSWGRASDFINKYMGLIGSALAGITGITMAFTKFRDERDKLEASSANLKALTGLGDEDVKRLEDTAKRLSTTVTKEGVRIKQSAVEIDDSFAIIGSQRPELLKNAEALEKVTQDAIYLSIASKDKLEPAAKALTTVMNQMNLGAENSRRIINAIAAGSQAGAGNIQYITDAFEKSGTTANLMNIQLEQHIGLIEAVAPKYSEAAVAGTSLDRVLLRIKEKNIGYKDGVFDLSRAIDELDTRFKNGESAVSLFGSEHAKMASILVKNKADILEYTEAVSGTNKAVEQAQINSDINEVKRAQARNKMNLLAMDLMEKLNPAINGVMDQTVRWTEKLVTLVNWVTKNSGLLITLASVLTTYTIAVKAVVYWQKIQNAEFTASTIAGKAWAVAASMMKGAQIALAGAQALLTGNINRARAAWILLNRTMLVNPFVAIGVAVAALTVGLYKLATRTTEATRANKAFNKELAKEKIEARLLFDALKRANEGTETRSRLIQTINEKYGQYLDSQLTEKSNLNEIDAALKQVNTSLETQIGLRIKNESASTITENFINDVVDKYDYIRKEVTKQSSDDIAGMFVSDLKELVEAGGKSAYEMSVELKDKYGNVLTSSAYRDLMRIKQLSDDFKKEMAELDGKFSFLNKPEPEKTEPEAEGGGDGGKEIESKKSLLEIQRGLREEAEKMPETTEAEIIAKNKLLKTIDEEISRLGKLGVEKDNGEKEEKKATDAKLKEVDRYVQQEKLKLKEGYLQNLMDKDEYNRQLEILELEALNRRLAIYGLDKDKQAEIQDKILSYKVKMLEETRKFEESQVKYRQKAEKKEEKAKKKALNDELQRIVAKNNEQQAKEYEEEVNHQQKMVELAQGFSIEIGTIVGGALSGNSDVVKSSLVSIINMGLDALKIQCQMAVAGATMQSLAQADSVATFGATGFARAALLAGLIEAAFSAVKAVVGNLVSGIGGSSSPAVSADSKNSGSRVVTDGFYDGGYSGNMGVYEVAGVVHGQEYIVPNYVYRLPAAMNHIQALEALRQQKTNTNPLPGAVVGYANGGHSGNPAAENGTVDNTALLLPVMQRLIVLLSSLEGGIRAYVVYSDIERKKQTLDKTRRLGGK